MKIQCSKGEWQYLAQVICQNAKSCMTYNNSNFTCTLYDLSENLLMLIRGQFTDDKNSDDDYDAQKEEFCTQKHTPSEELKKFFKNIEEAKNHLKDVRSGLSNLYNELYSVIEKLNKTFKVKDV